MRLRLATLLACLLCLRGVASAHRLDEYLQATLLAVAKDHVGVSVRLVPGMAVASLVIASIDSDSDGVFSSSEKSAYADRVLRDLTLTLDGNRLTPKLVSAAFPRPEQMKEGIGEIDIEFTADLPRGGPTRKLVLESHRNDAKSVYLVNCLLPHDPDIRVVAQKRNEQQSFYELDYVQAGVQSSPSSLQRWTTLRAAVNASGFASLFRLGVRHIAEGTDHVLFLLTLLLPAPLLAVGSRWSGIADLRSSLLRVLKIVTAFTIGHSITLALAVFGLVNVPGRPVEVLIAVSILVSAIHALRPIFPGKEAGIAAFFGLVHGLAFATTLGGLGLGQWERVAGILAFNLGIETMQMAVVAATLPSLLLLGRTRAYLFLRTGGALLAVAASAGWIAERISGVNNSLDFPVILAARHAAWLTGALFAAGFLLTARPRRQISAGRQPRTDQRCLTPPSRTWVNSLRH